MVRIVKQTNGNFQVVNNLVCYDDYATYCGSTIAMDEDATVLAAYAANSTSGVPAVFIFDLTGSGTLYPYQTLYLTDNNASSSSSDYNWNGNSGSSGLTVSADASYIVVGKDESF